nr:DUF5320 domain-containing protein [Bacteroidota bacterium]
MPGFDRTGPRGQGAMTGRGLGRCEDPSPKKLSKDEDAESMGFGRGPRGGFGFRWGRDRGFGGGRGFGRGNW